VRTERLRAFRPHLDSGLQVSRCIDAASSNQSCASRSPRAPLLPGRWKVPGEQAEERADSNRNPRSKRRVVKGFQPRVSRCWRTLVGVGWAWSVISRIQQSHRSFWTRRPPGRRAQGSALAPKTSAHDRRQTRLRSRRRVGARQRAAHIHGDRTGSWARSRGERRSHSRHGHIRRRLHRF